MGSNGFTFFPANVAQRVTHLMHDAELYPLMRVNSFNDIRKGFQAIAAGDEDIL